jgi:hypothetical protein
MITFNTRYKNKKPFHLPVYTSTGLTYTKLPVFSKGNLNTTIYLFCATEKTCEPVSVRSWLDIN